MASQIEQPEQELYNELFYYTLSHPDPAFIHQHVVDAYAAQTATEQTKPIKLIFSLAGLYLYLEKGFTGKQVQDMHRQMAAKKITWPSIQLPKYRGNITVASVVAISPGKQRDSMIKKWCVSVWETYGASHIAIIKLLHRYI